MDSLNFMRAELAAGDGRLRQLCVERDTLKRETDARIEILQAALTEEESHAASEREHRKDLSRLLDDAERRLRAQGKDTGLDAASAASDDAKRENDRLRLELQRVSAQLEAVRPLLTKLKDDQQDMLQKLAAQRARANEAELAAAGEAEAAKRAGERARAALADKERLEARVRTLEEEYAGVYALLLQKSGATPSASPSPRALQLPALAPPGRHSAHDQLGITVRSVPADAAVAVTAVLPPAAPAVQDGDLIVKLNDEPTPDSESFHRALAACKPGQPVRLEVVRSVDGRVYNKDLTVFPKPPSESPITSPTRPRSVSIVEDSALPLTGVASSESLASGGARRTVLPLRTNPLSVFKSSQKEQPQAQEAPATPKPSISSPSPVMSTPERGGRSMSLSYSQSPKGQTKPPRSRI
eukprot:gene16260-24920_t